MASKIQIFDPAMCCSSGVCGPSVDEALVAFANDVEWLKENGVEVERNNLAQNPTAFVDNPQVKAALESHGADGLPFIFVDDKLVRVGAYPVRDQLAKLLDINACGPEQGGSKCCPGGKSSCGG
jgi:hypothetical protein